MGAVEVKKHSRALEKSGDILGAQMTLNKADGGVPRVVGGGLNGLEEAIF